MRLATALLLIAAPAAAALAQPTPKPTAPAHSKPSAHKPAPPSHAKPSARKPAPRPPAKPAAPAKGKHPPPAPHAAPRPAAPPPAPVPALPAEPPKGSSTGLPLPRFAALRSDDVNFRTGPGTRYPIEWVYKRRDLPVEIEREFEVWRLVQDQEGTKGWVHQATLTGRRTAIVTGSERVLRQAADDAAGPVAKLQAGVILRLRSCDAGSEWCQAQSGDYRGWIKRSEIWGTLPGEAIQ